MRALGDAGEFRRHGNAVNSLLPRAATATTVPQMIPGVDIGKCRRLEIPVDAA